jgi:hypothetical protein
MNQRTVRIVNGIGLVALAFAAIGFVLQSTGLVSFPFGERRNRTNVVRVGGIPVQELPAAEGSVQFRGTVYVRGALAPNRELVFLFDKGFVSGPIVTDDEGRFTYTLPPGHWVLKAPYLPGFPGDIRSDIDPPIQNRDLSFDVAEGPITQTFRFVIHAD